MSDELVSGDHGRFDVFRLTVSTPEGLGADIRFNVACANPTGFNFHNHVVGSCSRDRDGFLR